jgi:hypothetical protein
MIQSGTTPTRNSSGPMVIFLRYQRDKHNMREIRTRVPLIWPAALGCQNRCSAAARKMESRPRQRLVSPFRGRPVGSDSGGGPETFSDRTASGAGVFFMATPRYGVGPTATSRALYDSSKTTSTPMARTTPGARSGRANSVRAVHRRRKLVHYWTRTALKQTNGMLLSDADAGN